MIKVKTVRKNSKVYKIVENSIYRHDKYKSCYFWTPPTNASQRRREEFEFNHSFELDGVLYEIEQCLELSCRNYYYSFSVYVNGQKKDIRALKRLTK